MTEITAAEAGVEKAGMAFSASLHDASLLGTDTAKRVVSAARPVLIGVGVLAGAVLVVRFLGARRGSRSSGSLFVDLARSAAISLAAVAGRRLAERWLSPSDRRAARRVASAVLLLVAMLALSPAASAQNKLSLDVEAAFPTHTASETGWGVGGRFGHAWNLLVLALIPEIGGSYHAFGGSPDATAFGGVVGMRAGINFILMPSVFAHVGAGHYDYATSAGEVSQTGVMYDVGAALDLTLLPVVDFGAHVAFSQIAGGSRDPFGWTDVGGHVTFTLGEK